MSLFDSEDGLGLAALVAAGEASPTELLDEAAQRLDAFHAEHNVLVERSYDYARRQLSAGLPSGPFSGVPFVRKDLGCDVAGLLTTAGSRVMADYRAEVNQTLADRFLAAGLVMMASTTVPPFCAALDTDRAPYGATLNPWDRTRTPGGSSSGSAALVGAGVLPMAHGNDGGGSLRIPAAWCGAFTVKPSRGRVGIGPIYTEEWLGFSAEGVITRTVRDSAALLDAIAGPTLGHRYVAPAAQRPWLHEVGADVGRLRIGVLRQTHSGRSFHEDSNAALDATIGMLSDLGHHVAEAAPEIDGEAMSRELFKTVAVDIANMIDDIGEMRGRPVNDDELEVMLATFNAKGRTISGQDYARINDVSQEVSYACAVFHEEWDLLLSPTMAEPPPPIGDCYRYESDYDAMQSDQDRHLNLTMVANVTGQPAMSVPLHMSPTGLPIGMMFTARYGDEATLFRLAAQLETAHPWRARTLAG